MAEHGAFKYKCFNQNYSKAPFLYIYKLTYKYTCNI